MSFPHPPSARRGLMRWLLLVVAFAVLGLLQGGHCDDVPVTAMSPASAVSHDNASAGNAVSRSEAAATGNPEYRHDHTEPPHPATTVEDCRPLVGTVAASAGVAAAPLALVLRTSMIRARPTMSAGRALPGVTLAALGVLRT